MGDRPRAHAVVTLGVAAVFLRAVPYPLQTHWDDGRFLVDNPLVREVSPNSLGAIFASTHFQAYHPLHLLSYWLDVPWTGAYAPALHAVNLALWAVAANLALLVYRDLGLGLLPAALAALAYAVHPAQVEAVSWATGRKDVLAALFAFAACLFHLRSRTWGDRRAWLARAAFACAALSKTTALPLPAVLWLADVLVRGERPGRALKAQIPALVVAVALAPVAVATWRGHEMIRATAGGVAGTFARVASTLAHQLGTAFWPSATAPMYSTRAITAAPPAALVGVALFALGATLAARWKARRALFAMLAFLALLLPVSNLVPLVFPWQDRYLSLPLFAIAFAFGAALDAARERFSSRLAFGLGAALVFALGARTVQYEGAWASESRLWRHAARTQPDAYYAWMKLGEVQRDAGDLDGAVRAYTRLLAIEPTTKLGYAALCQAVALRDERIHRLAPSRAEAYARALYAALDDAEGLRALGARMLASGHLRTLEIPLARALDLVPFPDAALERAARSHFRAGRPSVGWFYVRRMHAAPTAPDVRRFEAAARHAFARAPTW